MKYEIDAQIYYQSFSANLLSAVLAAFFVIQMKRAMPSKRATWSKIDYGDVSHETDSPQEQDWFNKKVPSPMRSPLKKTSTL